MILRDDDRPIRVHPEKRPAPRGEGCAWAGAYRLVMHYARGMRKVGNVRGTAAASGSRPRRQRCAVRVTYLQNRTRGQWRAHGRYLARDTATTCKCNEVGFNRDRSGIDISSEVGRWQSSGDPRLWKVILSPEFGDRIDLALLTRQLTDRMAGDLGTSFEWIAVSHHNTEHPHVHMIVRGVGTDGRPLQLRREYLKYGIREAAEDLCTRQIGYRTRDDAAEAERREIGEHRFTSFDRAILRRVDSEVPGPGMAGPAMVSGISARPDDKHLLARLAVLQRMGLVEAAGANTWRVRRDLEQVLRAMQRAADRQKTLAEHGVPISDGRLQIAVLDLNTFTAVEGRVLVHGQDEQTGRNHLMLEGTDAVVHFVEYTPEMELLRADGGLRVNSYLRLRRLYANGRSIVQVQDLGDSEKVLKNRVVLAENARALVKRGIIPSEDGWGGWLGKYQTSLANVANEMLQNQERQPRKLREQKREFSRGR